MTRIALTLLNIALLASCSGGTSSGTGQWHKAGANEQVMARDSTECREAAQEVAVRQYPYGGTAVLTMQRNEFNRSAVEQAQFDNCMQGKGYRRAL